MSTSIEQTVTDFEQTIGAFAEALGEGKIGPKIQFNDRVDISAMDLFQSILAELGLAQLDEEERHEDFAEGLVRRIFRDTPTTTIASRSGE